MRSDKRARVREIRSESKIWNLNLWNNEIGGIIYDHQAESRIALYGSGT